MPIKGNIETWGIVLACDSGNAESVKKHSDLEHEARVHRQVVDSGVGLWSIFWRLCK